MPKLSGRGFAGNFIVPKPELMPRSEIILKTGIDA